MKAILLLAVFFVVQTVKAGEWIKTVDLRDGDSIVSYWPCLSMEKNEIKLWVKVPMKRSSSRTEVLELLACNFLTRQVALLAIVDSSVNLNTTLENPKWYYPPPGSAFSAIYDFCFKIKEGMK